VCGGGGGWEKYVVVLFSGGGLDCSSVVFGVWRLVEIYIVMSFLLC
jgi:hypothetical protein